MRFDFNEDLTEFTGTWGYCDAAATANSWTGQKTAASTATDISAEANLDVCEAGRVDMTVGESYSCYCQPYDSVSWTKYNFVVGAGPYSPRSNLCLAALHGEAIGKDGGNITVRAVEEVTPYLNRLSGGGTINSSHDTKELGFSLAVDGATDIPGSWRPLVAGGMVDAKEPGDSFPMYCPKEWSGAGTVFGSGPYHSLSQICPAAVHAGVITKEGGFFTFIVSPPQDAYRGTERNGITSKDDGPAGRKNSFTFSGASSGFASDDPGDAAIPGIVENTVSDQWRPIGDLACMTQSLHFQSKPLSTPGTCYMCYPDAPSETSQFFLWSDETPDDGACLLEGG